VSEQIGAQIFIDAWGMVCPGQPQRAAELARRAASVSHDGEAIFGAQVIAAMEAAAFYESNVNALLDIGQRVIPGDCLINQLINDIRAWHKTNPEWRQSLELIQKHYGYDKYGGGCHIIPNHALVILALLYGSDSFQHALTIVNTCGWDTDCNSANVGCLMGLRLGLAGLDTGPDFRGPVADRVYIPTADGGRTVTDVLHEAMEVAQLGRALSNDYKPLPKEGARFHFDLPGAVQGFIPEDSVTSRGTTRLENVGGHSLLGKRALAIHYQHLAPGRVSRVVRETWPEYQPTGGYGIEASPTLYPGQNLHARLQADAGNRHPVTVSLFIKAYGDSDKLYIIKGSSAGLDPGQSVQLDWKVEAPTGCPIAWVGIEIASDQGASGTAYIDWLTWDGAPCVNLAAPDHSGRCWTKSWVRALSALGGSHKPDYWLIQNEGLGMAIQGTREWQDYTVQATFTPHLAQSFGLAARVQGLKRYYALRLTADGKAQLVCELDGTTVLTSIPWEWKLYEPYVLGLTVSGSQIIAKVNGISLPSVSGNGLLVSGAIGLLVEEGRVGCEDVSVRPL
jgi:hypothetical protein